ncbi:hypothetical protein B0I37DRAFT_349513 [Chaetomium sp. MPI-CAGE-AT-0009]|nr:hypothetical protein B0I37DRAFT_349513 [Chaetomium sp. MPI-CAGE-AT-0009]
MNGNKSKVSRPTHKGGRDPILDSRAFRWLKGLWKERTREPSFKLRGDHMSVMKDRDGNIARSIVRQRLATQERREGQTCRKPRGVTWHIDPLLASYLSAPLMMHQGASIASDGTPGRMDRRFVDQRVVNQNFTNDNSSGMTLRRGVALRRNTTPKQPNPPNAEQQIQTTYRDSPGPMTVEHRAGVRWSQTIVVSTPTPTPMPTVSNGEQGPDERNTLPTTSREDPTVMRPTPLAAPRSLTLRRQPGYRSLRRAAMEMERGVEGTPLPSHLAKPSYVSSAHLKSSGSEALV